jgi:hypothetical protein
MSARYTLQGGDESLQGNIFVNDILDLRVYLRLVRNLIGLKRPERANLHVKLFDLLFEKRYKSEQVPRIVLFRLIRRNCSVLRFLERVQMIHQLITQLIQLRLLLRVLDNHIIDLLSRLMVYLSQIVRLRHITRLSKSLSVL